MLCCGLRQRSCNERLPWCICGYHSVKCWLCWFWWLGLPLLPWSSEGVRWGFSSPPWEYWVWGPLLLLPGSEDVGEEEVAPTSSSLSPSPSLSTEEHAWFAAEFFPCTYRIKVSIAYFFSLTDRWNVSNKNTDWVRIKKSF